MKRMFAAALMACALLSPLSAAAQTAPMTFANPTLVAVRVQVTDLVRSERFYRETFGLGEAQSYGERERVLSLPGAGAPRITLIQSAETPRNGGMAMIVTDIDAVLRAAAASGGRVTREAQAVNMGGAARIGFIEDPDGVSIEVIQVGGAPAQ